MKEALNNIDNSIAKIELEIKNLEDNKKILKRSRSILFEINDICPECLGEGYYYRKPSNPYERSWDLRENCVRCNGTGKYITQL